MAKKKQQILGEIVFGIHPIAELLKAKHRKIVTLYTTKLKPKAWTTIEQHLPPYPMRMQNVSREAMTRMAGTADHQGVVALVQPFRFRGKLFDSKKQPFLVMLDGIQDPRNLGAILRSAYCTGVDGVLLCKKKSAPLSAVALKASAGLAEHLPIRLVASPQAAAEELKTAGYHLYLATLGGQDARTCAFAEPCCVVIGSEAVGVTKSLYKVGTQVTLPQRTADISYNASVAAGLLFFLVGSQNKRI